jgi:hypothetical protein
MSTPPSVSTNLAMPSTPNQFSESISCSSPSATPASLPSLSGFQSSLNEVFDTPISAIPKENAPQTSSVKKNVSRSLFAYLKMKYCDLTPRKKKTH